MPRQKRNRKNIRTSVKIHLICEGSTEKQYMLKLLQGYKNVTVESIDGGGYGKYKSYIERNSALYSVFLIVADLDKAQSRDTELKLLNGLIKFIHKVDSRNSIFLNGPDIEYWIACCLGHPEYSYEKLCDLGYKKGSTVNIFLQNNNGKHSRGKAIIADKPVYYRKVIPGKNYTLESGNLHLRQSNLGTLLEYIDHLNC